MIIKTTSHRSRDKLHSALGRKPQYHWTFEDGGCFVILTDPAEIEKARAITGITKCRCQDESKYMTCISWGTL